MSRFEKLAAAAWAALAGFAGLETAGLLSRGIIERAPLCLFHAATGLNCPGCGMTRALVAVFEGRLFDAWSLHPLSLPLIGVWTTWLAWGLVNRCRGRRFSEGWPDLLAGARGWAALAVVLSTWALRV